MTSIKCIAFCLSGIFLGVSVLAQEQGALSSGLKENRSAVAQTAPGMIRLPKGTEVRLMATETISSKKAKPGNTFKFQVHGDVKVENLVVIANKTTVLVTVQDAKSAGRAWHAGTLAVRLGGVKLVDQQTLPLESPSALKGAPTHALKAWAERIAGFQAYGLMFLPFSPLQHGNQAFFPKASIVEAATSSDALMDRADIVAAQPPAMGKQHEGDWITIYFMPEYWGSFSPEIWCGSVKVGILHSGRKMSLTLPPGAYFLHFGRQSVPVSLRAVDGGEHYLKLARNVLPDGKATLTFYVVEHDFGELEAADAKPVEAKEAPDISELDLTKLQAVPPPMQRR